MDKEFVYTLRDFRSRTKEAFDNAKNGSVQIKRGKEVFVLLYSSLENEYPNRPQDSLVTIEPLRDEDIESISKQMDVPPLEVLPVPPRVMDFVRHLQTRCKHGSDPLYCKHAKFVNGKKVCK